MSTAHDWRTFLDHSIAGGEQIVVRTCGRCNLVKVETSDERGHGTGYYWRGEPTEDDETCVVDRPVTLESIERLQPNQPLDRKVWSLLHFNVPGPKQDVVLEGLAKLLPEQAHVFQGAIRHREQAAIWLLNQIFGEAEESA